MSEPTWLIEERDGVGLACADYGGEGTPIVLLHGLAGYAGEWAPTAHHVAKSHRVIAPELRGHGRSERRPDDLSPEAFVADLEFWLERSSLAPAAIVGQSLGGLIAFLFAARRPDLVGRLVVVEATPDANPDASAAVGDWLAQWKQPFASLGQALEFFGDTPWGRAWAGGLEPREGGLWAAFDPPVMIETMKEAGERSYWDDWRSICCPALIIRGERGYAGEAAERMVEEQTSARLITVADAGHDLHLEQPDQWLEVLDDFIPKG